MIEFIKVHALKFSIGIVILLVIISFTTKSTPTPQTFTYSDKEISVNEVEYIYVDLKGYVQNPGVYKLEKGSRVFQVINMAGGYIDDADKEAVNLSKKIYDQEVIYIPSINEEYPLITEVIEDTTNIININLASLSQLESLPGIGPSTAQAIIDYRNEIGEFEQIEDIMNVSGIGESTYSKIEEYISIN